jgi:hypothetical protein
LSVSSKRIYRNNRKVDGMKLVSGMTRIALAVSIAAGAVAAGTLTCSPASAIQVNTQAEKGADAGGVVQVRWHGHRWGPGAVVGGIAAGIIGGAIAEGAYGPYGYGPYDYGYDYYPGYVYGPYAGWGGPYWGYRHRWHRW